MTEPNLIGSINTALPQAMNTTEKFKRFSKTVFILVESEWENKENKCISIIQAGVLTITLMFKQAKMAGTSTTCRHRDHACQT